MSMPLLQYKSATQQALNRITNAGNIKLFQNPILKVLKVAYTFTYIFFLSIQ